MAQRQEKTLIRIGGRVGRLAPDPRLLRDCCPFGEIGTKPSVVVVQPESMFAINPDTAALSY
jgi:hypothetical protein